MAERSQMLHGLTNSLGIIDLEYADVVHGRSGVHEDQGELALDEHLHQLFFDAEGHDGDAIHIAL